MKVRIPGKVILGGFAALLLAGFVFIAASNGPMAALRVTTTTVQVADVQTSVFGIGTVEAQRSYLIGPTAAGRVARILVDVGDTVQAGRLVAEMDAVDLDERAAAARAAVERASHAVAAASALVRDAEARRRLADDNAQRYSSLGKQAFFSQSAVEAKQQEAVSAQAGAAAARSSHDAARQDLARLVAEQAAVGKQKANLQLRAPADGIVTARDGEPGTTLVAGQSVVRMVDPASIWLKVRIDQGRSGGLKPGLPATVVLRSRPQERLTGKLVRLELNGDNVTEERLVDVAFDALPAGLSLGEMAEVTIELPKVPASLAIPNAAVRKVRGQEGVWLIADGRPVFKPVRVGTRSLDGLVQVLDGLQEGERLVVHSERELHEGDRLAVVDSLDKASR